MRDVVGVMGPGEQATPIECETAFQLGRQIAAAGWVLLTGGRNCGVMDAASRGAKSANGLTIGLLPTADRCHLSEFVDIAIVTGLGQARNSINVLSSQVVIVCGMGAGTASEVALALKADRPVILLHVSADGQRFFQSLTATQVFAVTKVEAAIDLTRQLLTVEP